ncbi:MAG: hypothetical protein AABY11_01785, partial [archaeon]
MERKITIITMLLLLVSFIPLGFAEESRDDTALPRGQTLQENDSTQALDSSSISASSTEGSNDSSKRRSAAARRLKAATETVNDHSASSQVETGHFTVLTTAPEFAG